MYKIINSNSRGNSIIYLDKIVVDCGIAFKHIEPYLDDIKIIALTHKHSDHINIRTISKIQYERPSVRIASPEWLCDILNEAKLKNIDILEMNKIYDYGSFIISPFVLYHDVPNCGYRIYDKLNDKKIFHATDTQHLLGISAEGYDLYALESNHCEEKARRSIEEARLKGEFCRVVNSMETHLSKQQAFEFFFANKKENSELIELHKSSEFYE